MFPFELSEFQQVSINAIKEGHHSLVTAGTGSGKTLPAEFCISYFTQKGLKVIYTSPIKALSNQKYYDFTRKFPSLQIGLITGDIKIGPSADVVIMTCEILRNNLFRSDNYRNAFEFDISQIGCVIFDEIHYINDKDRGHVWEECLIKLSEFTNKIQFLMLSATLDNPDEFASYIQKISNTPVIISGTSKRVVPLEHYSLCFFHDNLIKQSEKHPLLKGQLKPVLKTLIKNDSTFNEKGIVNLNKILGIIKKDFKNNQVSNEYIINQTAKYLQSEGLLPAIFFSLSRKNVMKYPKLIETNLYPEQLNNVVSNDAMYFMRKLPNYKEYINLPEYKTIIELLEKGIAYHHSGLITVFRELIELMFEKGHVKLLFATETFSVGINLPTKATIFDNLTKYDGSSPRSLFSHEYAQMAGRAGRRSIDPVGYSFILNNTPMFEEKSVSEYKEILSGTPQKLTSKININSDIILKFKDNFHENATKLLLNSSLFNDINKEISILQQELSIIQQELNKIQNSDHSDPNLESYIQLNEQLNKCRSLNQEKKIKKDINLLITKNPGIEDLYKKYSITKKHNDSINFINKKIEFLNHYISNEVAHVINELKNDKFINESDQLTIKGIIASNVQEVDSIKLANLIETFLDNDSINAIDIACSLSTLIEIDDTKNNNTKNNVDNKDITLEWIHSLNENECNNCINNSGLYIGTFIKMMIKLDNIINELENIKELEQYQHFKHEISKIHSLILKHIVTNQSLYIL